MRKKIVGMLTTATLLTMALAGNVQAAEIRSVGPDIFFIFNLFGCGT